jgi:hypothetical protein
MIKTSFLLKGSAFALSASLMSTAHASNEGWYTFEPTNDYSQPSKIGMEDWNSEPAGAHGRIVMREDKLFYDGEEIKLWGLNNTYSQCAPTNEMARKRADFYQKFGINAMRLHKYTDGTGWAGIQTRDSMLEFDPEMLDRMDYYVHVLKENGIYTKLSPNFGVKYGPADVHRIPYYKEIGDPNEREGRWRSRAGYGLVYLATEIQDLQIEQLIKILEHKNPHTGMRYADDPAIFCVELFNEDSVLFSSTIGRFRGTPTIRARVAGQFSDWLMQRYGSEAAWKEAWGEDMIIKDYKAIANEHMLNMVKPEDIEGDVQAECIKSGTVVPWGHSWFYDAAMRPGSEQAAMQQRLLDTMEFLISLQDAFYERFAKAIRQTGFEGEIIASNWQAGNHIGHFLNVYSDSKIGMIDRHNYFGGGRGAFDKQNPFHNGSMLASPGIGMLSVGFQQVTDLAFMFSEWIHVQPNEYYVEGPAILGAYGWGLNGWDVSYMFENNDNGGFMTELGKQSWDVSNPAIMGSFAAISRQVRRMDVDESPETKFLNIHVPSMLKNKTSFVGETRQQWDTKSFSTDKVPPLALAATRVALSFNDSFKETPAFDMDKYMDGDVVVSSTKQLRWTPAQAEQTRGGYFTINTKATKAFVGFAPGGESFDLGDGFYILPSEGFQAIYLTAKGEDETLLDADEVVVMAMARLRNTGMELNEEQNVILKPGSAPLVMEPVVAELSTPYRGTLQVLDHDGIAITSERSINKRFKLDGREDKTPFYLIQTRK